MEGVLNKAMAHALAGEHQLLTARRTPDAAMGLLKSAARQLREAADLADACRVELSSREVGARAVLSHDRIRAV